MLTRGALVLVVAGLCAACGSSPTAPSTPPPVVVVPPVVPPVPVLTIAVAGCPTSVVGVDLGFYRELGCNAFDAPASLQPVRRWTKNPNVFVQTADIDAPTLNMIEATAREMVPRWTNNALHVGTVERGAGTREGEDGWISIVWNSRLTSCGLTGVGVSGGTVQLFPRGGTNCACNGFAIRPRTVRHELGHALGYWHTDSPDDLMSGQAVLGCDAQPSVRELQAAAFHYR